MVRCERCAVTPWDTTLVFKPFSSSKKGKEKKKIGQREQRAKQPPDFLQECHVGICGLLHSTLTEPAAFTLNRMSTHS